MAASPGPLEETRRSRMMMSVESTRMEPAGRQGSIFTCAMGGLIVGSLMGLVAGAILGALIGFLQGEPARALDGSLLGAALLALIGLVYGAAVGFRDHRNQGKEPTA